MKTLMAPLSYNRKKTTSNYLKLIAFAVLLAFSIASSPLLTAQESHTTKFGMRIGANANSWTNEFPSTLIEGQWVFPDDWKTTYGFHGGLYINIRLSQLVALEPAILYTAKGTGTILNVGGSTIEGNINAHYLDFPLLLRLYLADGFNLIIGPQFSYHTSSNFDLVIDDVNIINAEDITNNISEFDFAPILGIGYEFESGFNINLSAALGLLTTDSFNELSTFNRNIKFSLGYSF